MKTWQLLIPKSVDLSPLTLIEGKISALGDHDILIRIIACGVCHTDLHIVEGDLPLPRLPLIPGHQVIGIVDTVGKSGVRWKAGETVGVPWLYSTCGTCAFCRSGRENLCDRAAFTGYHVDGGYAEYMVVHEDSAFPMPAGFVDAHAAPLLCGGVIGYRAIRLSEIKPGRRIGLFGFGGSAHIAIQILRHWNCEVYVFTRGRDHQELAVTLGAAWVGSAEERPPHLVDNAIIFAPAGHLVHSALLVLEKGGTIALAGIHMSPIPALEYSLLRGERTVRSVANSTRQDVQELLGLAVAIPLQTEVELFPLNEVNAALQKLKRSTIKGSAVLTMT